MLTGKKVKLIRVRIRHVFEQILSIHPPCSLSVDFLTTCCIAPTRAKCPHHPDSSHWMHVKNNTLLKLSHKDKSGFLPCFLPWRKVRRQPKLSWSVYNVRIIWMMMWPDNDGTVIQMISSGHFFGFCLFSLFGALHSHSAAAVYTWIVNNCTLPGTECGSNSKKSITTTAEPAKTTTIASKTSHTVKNDPHAKIAEQTIR